MKMKKIWLSGVLIIIMGLSLNSQNLIPSGKYKMIRDKVVNGIVSTYENSKILQFQLNSNGGDFTGNFIGINNDSQFIGKAYISVRRPGQTLFTMTQIDDDFNAVFVGLLKNGIIIGTWYTTAGDIGDFSMKRVN